VKLIPPFGVARNQDGTITITDGHNLRVLKTVETLPLDPDTAWEFCQAVVTLMNAALKLSEERK
jgi:hypothetical protein